MTNAQETPASAFSPPREAAAPWALQQGTARATRAERLGWLGCAVLVLGALFLSRTIEPDPRGHSTHEQIKVLGRGLEPCGFLVFTGQPCPSCGFTTTFALAVRGRFLSAAANQPFGFLVFALSVASLPAALVATVRGISVLSLMERWPWGRIALIAVALWLFSWAYKIASLP